MTVRMDKDVELLVVAAMRSGNWKNENRMANQVLRQVLTPLHPSKKISNLQEKMGVKL